MNYLLRIRLPDGETLNDKELGQLYRDNWKWFDNQCIPLIQIEVRENGEDGGE